MGLDACDLLIVCDGYRATDSAGRPQPNSKYRAGIVTPEAAARYERYKDRLRLRERPRRSDGSCGGLRVLALETRHGFGLAVRAALAGVSTPFVMVVQVRGRPLLTAAAAAAALALPHTLTLRVRSRRPPTPPPTCSTTARSCGR